MIHAQLSFLTEEENRYWQKTRGWLLPAAAEELYRCARRANPNGAVAEIGSFAGKSTVCIARGVRETRQDGPAVFAIDVRFQSDFRDNLNHFGVADIVRPLQMSSLDAAEAWTQPIAFLYIDGHHGRAHAYADLLVWDSLILPGAMLALDDTAGFFLGPNLQLRVALQTGAYELTSDVDGVSFLRKKHGIVPSISYFPLSQGCLIAYVDYIAARSGAMDPALRLPSPREQISPQKPGPQPRQFLSRLWNASPRQTMHDITGKLTRRGGSRRSMPKDETEISSRISKLQDVSRVLEWLEGVHDPDEKTANVFAYLRACLDVQSLRVRNAMDTLKRLSDLEQSVQFPHYRISVRDMSILRLAQAYDLVDERNLAFEGYRRLTEESAIPEIRSQAERGLSMPFTLPSLSRKLLLREYNLELAKYRDVLCSVRM